MYLKVKVKNQVNKIALSSLISLLKLTLHLEQSNVVIVTCSKTNN